MTSKKIIVAGFLSMLLSGCNLSDAGETETEFPGSDSTEIISSEMSVSSESTAETVQAIEYSESDKMVMQWFIDDMTDIEAFPDMTDYQYYARTLGLDKDHFLDPAMWEVFYNEEININKDIENKEYYLIRLNPYKLLEIYAENNSTDTEKLCDKLSISPAQLYYNWGYNPASYDYGSKHEKNTAAYSEAEEKIFGKYNGESRYDVMRTHLLIVDKAENICTYQSDVTDTLAIKRRDMLQAFTEVTPLYSAYSDEEKSPSRTVNGIGIRSVIPLTLPNAWSEAADYDAEITVMVNMSPYSYGCTDEDIIDIMTYINKQSNNEKK